MAPAWHLLIENSLNGMMYSKKFLQFLRDRRQIYFGLKYLFRKPRKSLEKIKTRKGRERVLMALTVDVEHDYGSLGNGETKTLKHFFEVFPDVVKERPSTFFVQGDLVLPFKKEIKKLQDSGHEIGLHGFHHELWGKEQWFLADKYIAFAERERLLKTALQAFDDAGLKPPISFRAPNLVIDDETYKILQKFGFKYDSSAAAFRGEGSVPYSKEDIFVVPVSCESDPHLKWKGCLPFWHFWMLDLYHVLNSRETELLEHITAVFEIQKSAGVNPHLVFFCHPWEFSDYCNDGNLQRSKKILETLEKQWKIKHQSIATLANKLKDAAHVF